MDRIYDSKERRAGYLDGNGVYDNDSNLVGYVQDPWLLDVYGNPVAYVDNRVLYTVDGMPVGYFDGWIVRDMYGNRLGRTNSSWLGLLAAGLLLGWGLSWGWNSYGSYGGFWW